MKNAIVYTFRHWTDFISLTIAEAQKFGGLFFFDVVATLALDSYLVDLTNWYWAVMTTAVNCYVQMLCWSRDRFAYFLVILHNQGGWGRFLSIWPGFISGRESRQCLLLIVVVAGGSFVLVRLKPFVVLTYPLLRCDVVRHKPSN